MFNGDNYGHVVNSFSIGTGPNAVSLNTLTDAHVTYPSVAMRGGILSTLGGIGGCGGLKGRGVTLYNTSGHPVIILRGGRSISGLSSLRNG